MTADQRRKAELLLEWARTCGSEHRLTFEEWLRRYANRQAARRT